jgi:predicted RNase H-like nuclease (RuvC/YqgF family)
MAITRLANDAVQRAQGDALLSGHLALWIEELEKSIEKQAGLVQGVREDIQAQAQFQYEMQETIDKQAAETGNLTAEIEKLRESLQLQPEQVRALDSRIQQLEAQACSQQRMQETIDGQAAEIERLRKSLQTQQDEMKKMFKEQAVKINRLYKALGPLANIARENTPPEGVDMPAVSARDL